MFVNCVLQYYKLTRYSVYQNYTIPTKLLSLHALKHHTNQPGFILETDLENFKAI